VAFRFRVVVSLLNVQQFKIKITVVIKISVQYVNIWNYKLGVFSYFGSDRGGSHCCFLVLSVLTASRVSHVVISGVGVASKGITFIREK
jgi:hypothetical protein